MSDSGRYMEHFESRIVKFREKLGLEDADVSLVTKEENIFYLTGFYAMDSGSLLIISQKNAILLNHFIFAENAEQSIRLPEIELVKFTGDRKEKLSDTLYGIGGNSIAIDGENITHNNFLDFGKVIRKQRKKVKNVPGIVEELRKIKDENEIKLIKKSCSITDEVTSDVLALGFGRLKDLSEKELSLLIENMMVKKGASGKSFELIVASGKASSLPHYIPDNTIIKNDLLLLDLGSRYGNYCSDITRTCFLGPQTAKAKKFREIYDIVLQAANQALSICRAGISCMELDKAARDIITGRGYGEMFGHGLGHGVGIEVHEEPVVSYKRDTVLEENMVITIEPGIYLEGEGGVRIEDMVVVKKNGVENLYRTIKNYDACPY